MGSTMVRPAFWRRHPVWTAIGAVFLLAAGWAGHEIYEISQGIDEFNRNLADWNASRS